MKKFITLPKFKINKYWFGIVFGYHGNSATLHDREVVTGVVDVLGAEGRHEIALRRIESQVDAMGVMGSNQKYSLSVHCHAGGVVGDSGSSDHSHRNSRISENLKKRNSRRREKLKK